MTDKKQRYVLINGQKIYLTKPQQQAYDKNGEPDKSGGVDHQNDGTTYPIAYEMPIRKPVINVPVTFAL